MFIQYTAIMRGYIYKPPLHKLICPYLALFSEMFIRYIDQATYFCSEADSRSSQVKGIRAKKWRCAVTTPTAYTGEAT